MEDFDWSEYNDDTSDGIVYSWAYKDFKKKFFSLRFIGYNYNPLLHDGSKVYTFMDSDRNFIKVFNTLGVTIDQIEKHREKYKVVLKKYGYYEFQSTKSFVNNNKDIIIAFEDEWLRYKDVLAKRKGIEEQGELRREIQKQIDRNADRFPYDLSGDDFSLDPNMW